MIAWGSTFPATLTEMDCYNENEFIRLQSRFSYYMMRGVKIEYKPIGNVQSAAGGTFYQWSSMASFIDQVPAVGVVTDANMRIQPDFNIKLGTGTLSKYVNLRKFYKKNDNGTMWQPTSGGLPDYKEAATLVRAECRGFVTDDTVGTVKVTWYVSFKGARD